MQAAAIMCVAVVSQTVADLSAFSGACPVQDYSTVTLLHCIVLYRLRVQAAPIVRVAVEPQTVADLPALSRGLRLLNRADPFVEVTLTATGEHVIAAAGEVHLERCIKDLQVQCCAVARSHCCTVVLLYCCTVVLYRCSGVLPSAKR